MKSTNILLVFKKYFVNAWQIFGPMVKYLAFGEYFHAHSRSIHKALGNIIHEAYDFSIRISPKIKRVIRKASGKRFEYQKKYSKWYSANSIRPNISLGQIHTDGLPCDMLPLQNTANM